MTAVVAQKTLIPFELEILKVFISCLLLTDDILSTIESPNKALQRLS